MCISRGRQDYKSVSDISPLPDTLRQAQGKPFRQALATFDVAPKKKSGEVNPYGHVDIKGKKLRLTVHWE